MNHNCSEEDRRYIESFEAYEIDADAFRHREHLRVAYVLIATYGLDTAFVRLKGKLLGLLAHLGVGTEKYHETVTYAWLLAVNHFMHLSKQSANFDEFIKQNRLLLDTSIISTHYSRKLLDTAEARARFVKPDRDPIPLYSGGLA